jgi:hypothetical protein
MARMRKIGDTHEMMQKRLLLERIEEALADAEMKLENPPANYPLTVDQVETWIRACKRKAAEVRADLKRLESLH